MPLLDNTLIFTLYSFFVLVNIVFLLNTFTIVVGFLYKIINDINETIKIHILNLCPIV